MKKWFIDLSNPYKTAFVSLIVVIVVFCSLVFGYFINYPGLPNGLLAGGLIGCLSYFTIGLADKIDEEKQKPVFTIVVQVVRYLLISALIVLAVLLEFKYQQRYLNVFTVIGGYMISLVIYIIISLLERQHV